MCDRPGGTIPTTARSNTAPGPNFRISRTLPTYAAGWWSAKIPARCSVIDARESTGLPSKPTRVPSAANSWPKAAASQSFQAASNDR